MIKEIIDNNNLYAKVIKANHISDKTEFFTQDSDELQFGIVNYSKNHKTGAHYHNRIKQEANQTDEIIMLQSGSARIDFYNDKGEYIKSYELIQGDIIILYKGGHNIIFHEDTKLFSIKPGPYDKDNSKTRIIGANNLELKIEKD